MHCMCTGRTNDMFLLLLNGPMLHDNPYLIGLIIAIDKQRFPSFRQSVCVDCIAMVLGGDKCLAIQQVHHWLIVASVKEKKNPGLEKVNFSTLRKMVITFHFLATLNLIYSPLEI